METLHRHFGPQLGAPSALMSNSLEQPTPLWSPVRATESPVVAVTAVDPYAPALDYDSDDCITGHARFTMAPMARGGPNFAVDPRDAPAIVAFMNHMDDPRFCEPKSLAEHDKLVMFVRASAEALKRTLPTPFSDYIDGLVLNKLESLEYYGQDRCWHCCGQGHRWRACGAPLLPDGRRRRHTSAAPPRLRDGVV